MIEAIGRSGTVPLVSHSRYDMSLRAQWMPQSDRAIVGVVREGARGSDCEGCGSVAVPQGAIWSGKHPTG
jgi:hypothetical protein